jgi:hypothetical protein
MPRTIQEILDHADELAERFENHEPGDGDERPVEEYMLERAALGRARSERQVIEAVIAARAAGASWQRIGNLLGTSTGCPAALPLGGRTRLSRPAPYRRATGLSPDRPGYVAGRYQLGTRCVTSRVIRHRSIFPDDWPVP